MMVWLEGGRGAGRGLVCGSLIHHDHGGAHGYCMKNNKIGGGGDWRGNL